MRIIISRPRQGGKTHMMLEQMRLNPNSAMVCITRNEADRLAKENPDIESWRFVTPDEARRGARFDGRAIPNPFSLYVDNLDMVLSHLLGRRVWLSSVSHEVDVID